MNPDALPEMLARQSTGVPGLEQLSGGGLVSGAVYIIQGEPGAGKTLLANQICFHRAAKGDRCLYFTLLSESHDRLLRHLRQMRFFDAARLPEGVFYASGFGTLEREGLAGIVRLLSSERRDRAAKLIVLDGLFVLEERAESAREFRRFIHDLASLAHLTDCTVLVLTNTSRGAGNPEFTMVDGWFELGREQLDYRSLRYLQIHKTRGSDFLSGRHLLKITGAGLQVYPRLESDVALAHTPPGDRSRRVSTGLANLDAVLNGGLPIGSTTLIAGPTGIGKTSLGLNFLRQCTPQAPGLLFGFYEDTADLIEKAQANGVDLARLIDTGAVRIMVRTAVENLLDELGHDLLEAVRAGGVQRLFVDGMEAFQQSAEHPGRIGRFLTALANKLRTAGVTTVCTLEIPTLFGQEVRIAFGPVSAVAQNIIVLRYVELRGRVRRTLAVMKARQSAFDAAIRELTFDARGIDVGEPFQAVDDILSGHARTRDIES